MKILFISHLGNDRAAGLCWSVPASVAAQQKYDDCFWINTNSVEFEHWRNVSAFHRLDELGDKLSLSTIASVFSRPDVVLFEGFYHPEAVRFSWQLRRNKIPYIIIPRSSLTEAAFHNHGFLNYLKKKAAVFLLLKGFTRHALAIQYLTNKEFLDSGQSWNSHNFIIPNGIVLPEVCKTVYSRDSIKGAYIGRPSLYQKGLDLLINACKSIHEELRQACFTIDCHMPSKNDFEKVVELINTNDVSDILVVKPAVYGVDKEDALLYSDVFIMTSRFEGHPMGLIEAMSYGLPVGVTEGTNMADQILAANAGWITESSVSGVIDMLRRIMNEKDLYVSKGKNARLLAAEFEWDKLAQRLHNNVLSLISEQ